MTSEEAVAKLDAVTDADPEAAHGEADNVLAAMVPKEVRDAYNRAAERVGFWYA